MKDKPKNKSVLLFSAGMDSLIMSYLLEPDVLLYFVHNNHYGERELESIVKLDKGGFIKNVEFLTPLYLKEFEREDFIIPSRNLLFLTIAANYGETIYIGAMHGDRTLDKSIDFLAKTQDILNFLYQEQHWCEKRTFDISAPFKDLTKTELVKKYIENGGSREALFLSYSCYEGKEKPCLKCKSCVRKAVALINNDIEFPEFSFANVPWLQKDSPIFQDILTGTYRGREDQDFLLAMKKTGYL